MGLAASRVAKSFDGREVLRDVDLDCAPGSLTVIMGASGSGKTTLLRIIAGLIAPDSGAVTFGEANSSPRLSYMPQGDSLLPWLSVRDNVLVPLRVGTSRIPVGSKERQGAAALVQEVGLERVLSRPPSQLSGGMKQRVALARSFISNPGVLLLDEPFSALDEQTRRTLETRLVSLVKAREVCCVFVTHSVDQAVAIGDQVYVLGGTPARLRSVASIPQQERPLSPSRYGEWRQTLIDALNA